jgi:hypothetical protein
MDKCLPSQNPPGGVKIENTPLFIAFGFDDNDKSGFTSHKGIEGMKWAIDSFKSRKNPDGTSCTCAFYNLSRYITEEESRELPHYVKESWKYAYDNGFEIGCHTHNHHNGSKFTIDEWLAEIKQCNDLMSLPYVEGDDSNDTGIGMKRSDIKAFRAPYLAYNDNMFKAVVKAGFVYDSTLQEGVQHDQDGTNFYFPYTLDEGSPGNKTYRIHMTELDEIGSYPGLWEMPVQVVIVPPDELCEKYGTEIGLRKKFSAVRNSFSVEDGKIAGLDYNCFVDFQMTADELSATLKYTLDLRLKGNRAPFVFGVHSAIYALEYDSDPVIQIPEQERRRAIDEFLDYALTKPEVYVVSPIKVIEWMKNPKEI